MADSRIEVDYGPPHVRHSIRGLRYADMPVGGVEVLMHRYVHLREWRLLDAADAYWRLYWPIKGRGRLFYDGVTHDLAPGSLCLIPPHTSFTTECARSLSKWYVHFTVAGIGEAIRPGIYTLAPSRRMLTLLTSACPASIERRGGPPHTAAATLDVIDLVSTVVRACLPRLQAPAFFGADATRVMRVLNEHATGRVTLHGLAEATGLTARSLSELVLRTTGFTPMRYLLELRLNTAMKLLRHTDRSIEQIARECGFGDRYHFTRIFTKHRATTPAAFRKEARA